MGKQDDEEVGTEQDDEEMGTEQDDEEVYGTPIMS